MLDGLADLLAGEIKFVGLLEVHPQIGAGTEITSQAQGCVGSDRALSGDDLGDAVRWHLERASQLNWDPHGGCVGKETGQRSDGVGVVHASRCCGLMRQADESPLKARLIYRSAVGLPLFLVWKSVGEPGIRGFAEVLEQRENHPCERKD